MKIGVFGAGYVGLVQAAVLAGAGHDVVCTEQDPARVEGLKAARVPFHEPGLSALVAENLAAGRLHFTEEAQQAVAHAGVLFIATGTPQRPDGSADISSVLVVAATIAEKMTSAKTVVTKSTVPPGTAARIESEMRAVLRERGASHLDLQVVSNPEFLKEGSAIADFMRPDRIILGTGDATALAQLREIYAPFNRNHDRIMVMDATSAELAKYAANAMLASRISLMNELAVLAGHLGADIEQVRQGIGADPRIGWQFLWPGPGYGGSCFPKDVRALIRMSEDAGIEPLMLAAIEARNQAQKQVPFARIAGHFGADGLKGKVIALWGLSFKPNTDDIREAPALVLIAALRAAGAEVRIWDPAAMGAAGRLFGNDSGITLGEGRDAVLDGADALAVITDWQEFKAPDFAEIRDRLRRPVIFDFRNLYDPAHLRDEGFTVIGIGRGAGPVA